MWGRRSTWRSFSQLGQLSEAISVTAEAPLLRTSNPEIADIIDNRQMQALPAQRTAVHSPGPAHRRCGDSSRRDARRRARTGGAVAQRVRPERRPQHLPHRRRESHRRVLQQSRRQPVDRCDPGIQDSKDDVSRGVWRQGVRADQCHHEVGHQSVRRQCAGVRQEQRVRCPQLLRQSSQAGADAESAPIRRQPWWPAEAGSRVLLLQL